MLRLLRAVFISSWFFGMLAIFIPFSLLRPFNNKNGYWFCRFGPKFLVRFLGVDYKQVNIQQLTDSQPCVYVANHQHTLDIILLASLLPPNTISIGKKAVRWIPLFGWVYWLSGQLLIHRKKHNKAMNTMSDAKVLLTDKKTSIWIFPEGTRSTGRGLLAFKKGAFHLAIDAQVPIQPIVLSSYVGRLDLNKLNAGKLIVEALPPIATTGKTKADVDELTNQTFKAFEDKLQEMNHLLQKQ